MRQVATFLVALVLVSSCKTYGQPTNGYQVGGGIMLASGLASGVGAGVLAGTNASNEFELKPWIPAIISLGVYSLIAIIAGGTLISTGNDYAAARADDERLGLNRREAYRQPGGHPAPLLTPSQARTLEEARKLCEAGVERYCQQLLTPGVVPVETATTTRTSTVAPRKPIVQPDTSRPWE